jgi:hypothetical protein
MQHFGGFFHQIKVRQQVGRMRRLEGFLCEAAKNFELCIKIQNKNLKI